MNRCIHADPPRAFSAFLRHPIQTDANSSAGDSPKSPPRSRHPGGVAGTGGILPACDAPLWSFNSIFVERFESRVALRRRLRGFYRKVRTNTPQSLDLQGFWENRRRCLTRIWD